MKSKERTKVETTYAHAAQIFCEMLGQVCHKEFYDNIHTTFQEVNLSSSFPVLITGICRPCETCNLLSLLRPFSKQLSQEYRQAWRQVLFKSGEH